MHTSNTQLQNTVAGTQPQQDSRDPAAPLLLLLLLLEATRPPQTRHPLLLVQNSVKNAHSKSRISGKIMMCSKSNSSSSSSLAGSSSLKL